MRFTHQGLTYDLTAGQVIEAVRGVPPGRIQKHAVLIDGVRYPVRQVMAVATSLAPSDFTSHAARRHLERLGFPLEGEIAERDAPNAPVHVGEVDPHAWPWEGAVQDVFIAALRANGWEITGSADTATKQHGVDVLAAKDARHLGAEVKGWPSKGYADPRRAAEKKRTQPSTQAVHWYSQALLKAVMLLDSHPGMESLVVLPDYARYRDLARRTATGRARADVHVVLLTASGDLDSNTWAP